MPSEPKYTDEYLKKVLLDKVKELGRVPTSREVEHRNAIANRFGNGSYNDALIHFGLKPNIRINKKIYKETLKSMLEKSTCMEVYEMVLKGKLKQFPMYFWQDISDQELRELLIYFFEERLKWTVDDIKNKLNTYIFAKHKLGGMFQTIFNGSPFKVIDFTYPNKIKEWELKCTPNSYWTIEKCIENTKYILDKENWTDEDIKSKSIYELLSKYGLTTIYTNFFDGNSSYNLINAVYPEKFKPWEIAHTPKNYWTEEKAVEAIKWMIEEKLKWTDEEIKAKYCYDVFKEFKMENMLKLVFQYSPYKAINTTYPNKFKEEDFCVPKNYWTKEKAVEAFKKLLDGLSEEDIKKYVSVRFFTGNGLQYPFEKFFKNRPFTVLEEIYPNKFDKKDFDIRSY